MIQKLRNISYEMRLKECGLTTLETRRLRGDQIEVFKILNGYMLTSAALQQLLTGVVFNAQKRRPNKTKRVQ